MNSTSTERVHKHNNEILEKVRAAGWTSVSTYLTAIGKGIIPVYPISPCLWTPQAEQPDYQCEWSTSCGQTMILDEGRPVDNFMIYCPFCAAKIEVQEPV